MIGGMALPIGCHSSLSQQVLSIDGEGAGDRPNGFDGLIVRSEIAFRYAGLFLPVAGMDFVAVHMPFQVCEDVLGGRQGGDPKRLEAQAGDVVKRFLLAQPARQVRKFRQTAQQLVFSAPVQEDAAWNMNKEDGPLFDGSFFLGRTMRKIVLPAAGMCAAEGGKRAGAAVRCGMRQADAGTQIHQRLVESAGMFF